jgi:hypothetical protein
MLDFFGIDTQQHTLKLLGVDSERLDELTRAFPDVLNKRRISKDPGDEIRAYFFYETLLTTFGFKSIQVGPLSHFPRPPVLSRFNSAGR